MSDHLSSPRALQDPVIDLTDLYFFPVPEMAGRLAAVVNVFPGARPGAVFSDAVIYRLRLAPAAVDLDDVVRARREREITVDFTFADPDDRTGSQDAVLRFGGETFAFGTGEDRSLSSGDVRVFAGLRRDSFFMDVRHDVQTRTTRHLSFTDPGVNAVDGQNALSIVVEFDAARRLGQDRPALWAIAAETVSRGTPTARFERIGRPEAKNILLSTSCDDAVNSSVDLRDLYNIEDAFALTPVAADVYRTRFDANLVLLDALDDDTAWSFKPGEHHPLTETILNDHLVLDTTKPFCENGYLDIERAALTRIPHTTCGGRWLNEDVIDVLYSITVGGWDGPHITDGVDQASVPASRAFPYLAASNPNPPVPDPGVPVHAA